MRGLACATDVVEMEVDDFDDTVVRMNFLRLAEENSLPLLCIFNVLDMLLAIGSRDTVSDCSEIVG